MADWLGDKEYGHGVLLPHEVRHSRGGHRNMLTYEFGRRITGTVMEPSVFVKYVSLWYRLVGSSDYPGPVAELDARWEFSPAMYRVIREWEAMYGKTRAKRLLDSNTRLAFSCGTLCTNEMEHKLSRAHAIDPYMDRFDTLADEREEIRYRTLEIAAKYARAASVGEWTYQYIDQHDSSVKPGLKWKALRDSPGDLERILRSIQARWRYTELHMDDWSVRDGDYALVDPNCLGFGIRARGPDIDPVAGSFKGVVPRSRMVMFNPAVTGLNAFIDPSALYNEVMTMVFKVLNLKVGRSPIKEGGHLWVEIYDKAEGNEVVAHDGSTWELNCPAILRLPYPVATDIGGADCLISGCDLTSIVGSETNAFATAVDMTVEHDFEPELAAFLGDDRLVVVNDTATVPADIPHVYERDNEATEFKRYLGLVMLDEERWHSHGFKCTLDKPDAAIKIQSFQKWRKTPHYDADHIDAVVSVYCGVTPDGTPMREVLSKTELYGDYIAPSTIRDALIASNFTGGEGSAYEEQLEAEGSLVSPV